MGFMKYSSREFWLYISINLKNARDTGIYSLIDVLNFGIFVCKNIKTANDFTVIRDFLTSNAKFLKSTSIDLMEFAA